jgi:hypothetical protein
MSQVGLLHAQAYIRSLPADQRSALADPVTREVELARHGIDTSNLTEEEWQVLQAEITGVDANAVPQAVQAQPSEIISRPNLQQEVQHVLDTDQRICDWAIDALAAGPVVTLTGTVNRREDKQLVEQIVRAIPGVSAVVNDIEIV